MSYIIELILIIFLLFVFALSWKPNTGVVEKESILTEIENNLKVICNKSKVEKSFNIHPSTNNTYAKNKKDIYIVVRNKDGNLYDKNTIYKAAIHELAHVLCPSNDHGPLFQSIENNLLKIATDIKLYNPKKKIDSNYPCLNQDI